MKHGRGITNGNRKSLKSIGLIGFLTVADGDNENRTGGGDEEMSALMEAYIAGFLVGFLTFITLRTMWKCFTDDEKGEFYNE